MTNARRAVAIDVLIFVLAVVIYPAGDAFLSTCRAGQTLPAAPPFEGRFELHRPIPVGIIAGTAEHPKLAEFQWIRFETAYGNAWGVTARVGWSVAQDARWQIRVELLDEKGQLLKHSRDEATMFTAKAAQPARPGMQYADLALGAMHDQGRRHASRFRVYLEPAGQQAADVAAGVVKHTLQIVAVREDNQEPIPDATVLVTAGHIERERTASTSLYTTDAQGKCRVELPKGGLSLLSITVQKEGFASMGKTWSNQEAPLTNLPDRHVMEMLTAQPIGGVVHDEEGNPIAGVEVRVNTYLEETSGHIYLNRTVRTDAQGRWRLDRVPTETGRLTLGLRHPDYICDWGHERQVAVDELLRARAFKHDESMTKGLPVTGVVLNSQGQSVVNATIIMAPKRDRFLHGYAHTVTDAAGRFRFGNARDDLAELASERGLTALIVEAPGYAPTMEQVTVGPGREPVEFRLERGRTISGRVIDQQGQPIAQAWAVVQPLQGYRDYSVWLEDTDEQGRFQVPNAADDGVLLTVGKRGYIAVRDHALAPSEQESIVTMKPVARVGGKVTDAETGKAIPNFEVATMSSGRRIRSSGFAAGQYEMTFDEAQPQQFELQVSAVGYRPSALEALDISQGNRTIDFKLARDPSFNAKSSKYQRGQAKPTGPRRITGAVRDEKGEPVADATVITRPPMASDAITNSQGEFKIRWRGELGPGENTVYLVVRHKQRNLAAALELEEDAENLDIKLAPGVILSGKVVREDGQGIPEAEMSLTFWVGDYGYGSQEETEIDQAGRFEIRAIPVGHRYSVQASAKGYGRQYVQVHTAEAMGNRMELEPLVLAVANLSVSGVVVDADGKPVAGARLGLSGRGQPARYDIPTDEQGRFTVEGVCAGPLRLYANVRGETRLYGSVETQGGATDLKIVVSERGSSGRFVPKQPPSLVGKPLPGPKDLGIELSLADIEGKMILMCFWDMQQRPSRYCIMQLVKQAEQLKQKGVTVLAVQASKVEQKALNGWVEKYNIPFPVGTIEGDAEKTRFAWGLRSLPWLILTDSKHVVIAEGFQLSEFDKLLDQFSPTDREGSEHAPVTHFQPENKKEPSTKRASLEVRVTYQQDGTLIEGARVSFTNKTTGESFKIETAPNGVACIDVEPGDYAMTNVSKEGYRSHKRDVQMTAEAGKVDHIDIELPDAPKVIGYVRDQKGKPVPGTSVHMVPYGPTGVVTDATGKFEFKWDPRGIQLFLVARHVELALAGSVEFHNRYGQPIYQEGDIVEISLDTGLTLAGRVTDANGSGIAGANVAAKLPVGGGPTPVAKAKTDPNGHYGIKALPLGHQYRLEMTCDGYGPQAIEGWGEIVSGAFETMRTVKLNEAGLSVSGVVVDANGNPVDAAEVRCWGNGQPEHQTRTHANGKFLIEGVCQGHLRIQVRKERLSGVINTEGGSQNVKIILEKSQGVVLGRRQRESAQPPTSLVGKALPDLKDLKVELGPSDAKDRIVLVCFFDMQQQPSRNCMMQLSTRAQELKTKDVFVVAVHASEVDENTLNQWVKENEISFPVGVIQGDAEKTRFAWGVRSLPWLILTNREHVVTGEGFAVNELDEKIQSTE